LEVTFRATLLALGKHLFRGRKPRNPLELLGHGLRSGPYSGIGLHCYWKRRKRRPAVPGNSRKFKASARPAKPRISRNMWFDLLSIAACTARPSPRSTTVQRSMPARGRRRGWRRKNHRKLAVVTARLTIIGQSAWSIFSFRLLHRQRELGA